MTLTVDEKKALQNAVEVLGNGFYQDMEVSKGELDNLAKQIENEYGIKKADFKKMVKFHYLSSMDEEFAKVEELYKTYMEITK
jgi:hypothetical protein